MVSGERWRLAINPSPMGHQGNQGHSQRQRNADVGTANERGAPSTGLKRAISRCNGVVFWFNYEIYAAAISPPTILPISYRRATPRFSLPRGYPQVPLSALILFAPRTCACPRWIPMSVLREPERPAVQVPPCWTSNCLNIVRLRILN